MRPTSNMPPGILKSLRASATGDGSGAELQRDIDLNGGNDSAVPFQDRAGRSRRETGRQSRQQQMIGKLAGAVAEDFSNLLNVIETGQALIGKYSGDDRIGRVLELNRLAIDKSRRRLAQLLAFSGRQKLRAAPTDINATILVFEPLIAKAIDGSRDVQWRLAADLPPVHIDAGQLQSALLNLIVNAREATLRNGRITIFTEVKSRGPYEQYVVLGVSDTGTGMSRDQCEQAIEPFYTTRDMRQGAGLGLSQCDGFARQSGGVLEIESTEGTGTTVRMTLPALSQAESPAIAAKRTVLLVNDAFAVRSLLGEMLRGLGHIVLEAEDARDAVTQLQSNASIDLLFTDIIMPDGSNRLPALLAEGYPRDVLRNIAQLQAMASRSKT